MAPHEKLDRLNLGSIRIKSTSSPTTATLSNLQPQPLIPRMRSDNGILTLRYEEAILGSKPIPVTVAPPRAPPTDLHPALRVRRKSALDLEDREWKRDSGLAPTTSSKAGEESLNSSSEDNILGLKIDFDSGFSSSPLAMNTPQTPTKEECTRSMSNSESVKSGSMRRWARAGSKKDLKDANTTPTTPKSQKSIGEEEQFSPITTPIPSEGFGDDFMNLSFSKRGSVMLGGKKAVNGHLRYQGGRRQPSFSMLASPNIAILPDEVEKESQKVRSMYEQGSIPLWEDGQYGSLSERLSLVQADSAQDPFTSNSMNPGQAARPESNLSFRKEHELAGGIEDWEDVNGRDVDRYGFISKRRSSRPGTPEMRSPQRVSTILQLASSTPRKNRVFGRAASTTTSIQEKRAPNRKVSAKSLKTQGSTSSRNSVSRMRSVSNRLPGNQDRRWLDEAGDMLTLPPGLADIAEDEEGGRAAEAMKKKEWERTEKWRKMAKVVKTGKDGEGMEFEFDARNPKLIERTWKGIPDRWRASAWYSFLASSAKKRKDSPTDQEIIHAFQNFVDVSSRDDLQIDLDVPRTINSHIMFRRRYRGGQRLLFRVLHCLSLYFPDTGYVQGMAGLAATLLCYYDEERAFVMLVRMWTLRGLAQLYANGFGGLMSALEEFQKKWLDGREVALKLNEMNIEPTSYGTRWYLTLFNYSIPFAAQLRVWDVFMLLGDSDLSQPASKERPFSGGLDVLHATSAALIDGTREILLDSDFENAMKVLTSWIPIKDEELLMKVTKAEWKLQRGKKRP